MWLHVYQVGPDDGRGPDDHLVWYQSWDYCMCYVYMYLQGKTRCREGTTNYHSCYYLSDYYMWFMLLCLYTFMCTGWGPMSGGSWWLTIYRARLGALLWCIDTLCSTWDIMKMFWDTILYNLKMKFLGLIFGTLQVGIGALVWGIRTYSRVCLNSN